jgi:hypothetical protein
MTIRARDSISKALHIKSKVPLAAPFPLSDLLTSIHLGNVVASADNPFGEPSDFIDPLSLGDACKRDLPFLQELGVNVIRVYSVNSTLNHDACMNAFSQAGIYAM